MPETGSPSDSDQPTGPQPDESVATFEPSSADSGTGTAAPTLKGGPPRPVVWLGAVLVALGLCAFVPWFQKWFAGAEGAGISLFGSGFLPVVPLFTVLLLAVLWNPLTRLMRAGWLALRPAELLIVTAMLYIPAGLTESGLRGPWIDSLFMESSLRSSKNEEVLSQGPYPFSMPAEGDVRDAYALNKQVLRLLDGHPETGEQDVWSADLLRARDEYGKLVLAGDRKPSPDVLNRLAEIAERPGQDAGDAVAEIRAVQQALEADLALFHGMTEGNQQLASLTAGVGEDGSGPSPASRLQGPLFNSATLIIACLVLVLGIGAMTGRQWTHNERLQHPLIQVPGALSDQRTLLNKFFWIGLGSVLAVWLYQLLGPGRLDMHPLPLLPIGDQALVQMPSIHEKLGLANAKDRWVYSGPWATLRIYPYVIAIAFLLAADMSFSIWGGFFFGALIMGWLAGIGLPVSFYKHARKGGGGGGALLAMALVILWLGRHHYWRLLKAAFGAHRVEEDPAGVLGARLVLASGVAILLLIWGYTGANLDGFLAGVFGLLVSLAFILVTARVVAESGLACFQSTSHVHELLYGMGLPWALPFRAMVMLTYLGGTMFFDTRQNLAGFTVQSQALADRAGQNHRGFVWALGIVVVVGAIIAIVVSLMANWTAETGLGPAGGERLIGAKMLANAGDARYQPVLLGLTEKQLSVTVGFLLVFAVVGLRRVWSGCWLNPLGLVVAASWPIHLAWGSLMIGWWAKLMVLRYGGSGLYGRLKPLAFGIILGDVSGYGLMIILRTFGRITDTPMPEVGGAWP